MATLLIGYDTESAAVGEGLARFLGPDVPQYRAALDPDTTRRGVALLARLHEELEAPCTFFVCGRTLLHALDAFEPLAASPLFDIQQHTYSHVVFRDVRYRAEGSDDRGGAARDAARRAARGAPVHLGADPQVPRPRVHRPADAVRLLPRPARPARPARDRRARPATASSPRGAGTRRTATRRRGCSRSPTPRRASRRPARDPVPVLARRDLVRRERLRRGARVPQGARGRGRRDRRAGPRVRDRVPRVVRGRGGRGGHRLDPRPDRARAGARRRGHELRRLLGPHRRGDDRRFARAAVQQLHDRAP